MSSDSSGQSLSPLDVPKELWRLVDFIFMNGLNEVSLSFHFSVHVISSVAITFFIKLLLVFVILVTFLFKLCE